MVAQDSGNTGSGEAREVDVDIRHVGITSKLGTEAQFEADVELSRAIMLAPLLSYHIRALDTVIRHTSDHL